MYFMFHKSAICTMRTVHGEYMLVISYLMFCVRVLTTVITTNNVALSFSVSRSGDHFYNC